MGFNGLKRKPQGDNDAGHKNLSSRQVKPNVTPSLEWVKHIPAVTPLKLESIRCSSLIGNTLVVDSVRYLKNEEIEGDILIVDTQERKVIQELRGHKHVVTSLCIDPVNPNRLVSGSRDGIIKVWDRPSSQCVATLQGHKEDVRCLLLDQDTLYSGGFEGSLKELDLKTLRCVRQDDRNASVTHLLKEANDLYVDFHGHIRVWDTEKQAFNGIEFKGHTGAIGGIHILNDLLVTVSWDKSIRVWDKYSGMLIKTIHDAHDGFIDCSALSEDRRVLFTGSWDRSIRAWNTRTWERLAIFENAHDAEITTLQCHGQTLISGSFSNGGQCKETLKFWDFSG